MNFINILNQKNISDTMNGKLISVKTIEKILETIRSTPSASGLQPYTVYVIENNCEIRQQLEQADPTKQLKGASHILIFASWKNITDKAIDEWSRITADSNKISLESLSEKKQYIQSLIKSKTQAEVEEWNTRQAYIALGTALITAANEKVDAFLMDNFNTEIVDRLLKLEEKNQHSIIYLVLGYHDRETQYNKTEQLWSAAVEQDMHA